MKSLVSKIKQLFNKEPSPIIPEPNKTEDIEKKGEGFRKRTNVVQAIPNEEIEVKNHKTKYKKKFKKKYFNPGKKGKPAAQEDNGEEGEKVEKNKFYKSKVKFKGTN